MHERIGTGRNKADVPKLISCSCPKGYGFTIARLREIYRKPDQQHKILYKGLEVRLLQKSEAAYTDIVGLQVPGRPRNNRVVFAIRSFPDLCVRPLATLPPLELLREFAEKFGLDIVVGGKKSRFILCDEVPAPAPIATKLFRCEAPAKQRHYHMNLFFKPAPPMVNIALAFCLDSDRYLAWIHSQLVTADPRH